MSGHGAFVYLFNEPDDPPDKRNCFFGIWGGSADQGGDAQAAASANFVKAFDRTTNALGWDQGRFFFRGEGALGAACPHTP